MNIHAFLIVSFGISGAFWRAAFVAALALIAFVLVRYWKSLSAHSKRTRYLLVCLRGLSLVLLMSAFVGVRIEYESRAPIRVLIQREFSKHSDDGAKERVETEVTRRVIASLKNSDVDVIEQPEIVDVSSLTQKELSTAAAILITDGAMRDTDARRDIEKASESSGGSPVFVVTDIQAKDTPRVALNSITVTNRPVRGVPLQVRCLVHARGMRGRATLVTISDDAQVRVSAQARWTGDDERQVLNLEVMPKTSGWVNYLVRAEAAGGEDPTSLARAFTIYAEERRQRILFLEGAPSWEAKFIRRVLEKADLFDVDYFAKVSRAAMVGARDEQAGSSSEEVTTKQSVERGNPETRLREALSSAARLNSYDCIIVGATPDALLSSAEATRVREWLERRGGGLIILGGNNFAGSIVASKGKLGSLMPAEIDSSGFRSESQTLALSAPVEAEKSRGRFLLTPTGAGQTGALHAFSIAIEGSAREGALSGEGLRFGQLRPGSTVLAVTGQAGAQGTSEDGAPLIAAMRYGAGLSLVFGPADSWRMRTTESGDQTESDGPFASLWQGMTLWAASGARPPVEIVISEDSPEAGGEATAEIRVRDEAYAPMTIEKLSARLQQVSETEDETSQAALSSRDLSFAPDPNDSSIWRARFTAPSVGRYDMQIKYTAKGKSGAVDKQFATVTPSSIETGASRDTLQRVARGTGGDLFAVANLKALNDSLAALHKTNQSVHRTLELRSWWPLALIIPLLLSCEWLTARIKMKGEN